MSTRESAYKLSVSEREGKKPLRRHVRRETGL
jgi:hypothetical protein